MQWKFLSDHEPHSLEELKAILLENRQVSDPEVFFHPPHPLDLTLTEVGIDDTQMAKTIARLAQARDRKEDVLIFGDYDADGICSTAILWEGLKAFGIIARPFIPHREKHGYGLSVRSLEAILAERKPDLLITVDNGIVAHESFAQLKELGIDAILTDHHQTETDLGTGEVIYPPAYSVVHTTQLCGAGVAWFVARELDRAAAERSLDLTAIATIADQMSLVGVCRSFVRHGLVALQQTERVGLQLLCAKAAVDCQDITASSINFIIAPRINAMGRLKHGLDALRLLCTKTLERAEELVAELNTTNTSRQELTQEMVEHALQQAHTWEEEHIIIVDSVEYHEGVIGLIAGKLAETFAKPAIVISTGPETAKASARSIPGINIIDLIRLVKDDLLEAGGHPMAAGFGLMANKIDVVRARLQKLAKAQITPEMLVPSIEVECSLPAHLLRLDTVEMIQEFAPFGQGNREPVFGLHHMQLLGLNTIGREGNHVKVNVSPLGINQHQTFTGIGWRLAKQTTHLQSGDAVQIAAALEENEWKGRKNLQLTIRDITVEE